MEVRRLYQIDSSGVHGHDVFGICSTENQSVSCLKLMPQVETSYPKCAFMCIYTMCIILHICS